MKRNKGFTLIELLVVIAIIGILSAIVLASLSSARNKAKDAKVSGELSSMRAAAEIYYGSVGGDKYLTPSGTAVAVCPFTNVAGSFLSDGTTAGNGGGWGLISAIEGDLGITVQTATSLDCGITSAGDAWAVSAKLNSGFWCVDSTGASKSYTGTVITVTKSTGGTACL